VIVHVIVEGYEYLFDLPPVSHVATRLLRRVRAAFVTHTHVDHFVGMGHFLRVNLTRDEEVLLVGPEGFVSNVNGFLSAFTWNLGEDYPFRLRVLEVGETTRKEATFSCRNHFVMESLRECPSDGPIVENEVHRVTACTLDHGIPVLAFRMEEHDHVNINAQALTEAGLPPGPWLKEIKRAIKLGMDESTPMDTPAGRRPIGEITRELVIVTPGRSIGYVVDTAYHEENLERLIPFLEGVDILYMETAFPEGEEERALERNHFNAFHAAVIAQQVRAKRLRPLHISPKYLGHEEEMVRQMAKHFSGEIQLSRPYRKS